MTSEVIGVVSGEVACERTDVVIGVVFNIVVVVVTGVVIDVVNESVVDLLKLSIACCVSVASINVIGSVFVLLDVIIEVSNVSVDNCVNFSVDVFIEGMFVVVVADDVIGDFVDFTFEFTDTGIVVAVIVAMDDDSVADNGDKCGGEIVVGGIFVAGLVGVDVVDDATVNFNDESSDIIDDAVESFIDDAEVIAEDGVGFILDGSTKLVVDDLDVVVGDDFVETVAVESIDWVTDDFIDVIASSGFVIDDNDSVEIDNDSVDDNGSVEIEVAGFADVSDDNIDADVESCVEIDS